MFRSPVTHCSFWPWIFVDIATYQRWAVQIKSELGKFWDSRKCFNLKTYFSLKMSMFVNLSMYDLNKTRLHISYSDWLWPLVHTVSSPTISVMSRIFKISFPNAAFFASSSRNMASVNYSWLYLKHHVLPVLLTSSQKYRLSVTMPDALHMLPNLFIYPLMYVISIVGIPSL